MHKIALVLAIAAVGEGAVTLHLVRQLHLERDNAQTLQARVTELERKVPQPAAAGATFVAIPRQPTVSPFAGGNTNAPPPQAVASRGSVAPASAFMAGSFSSAAPPDQQQMREQINASMERQRALMRDPDYRDAMLMQQKMALKRQNAGLAKDLDLTAEQAERLVDTMAEQAMRSMENANFMGWGEQPDAAKMQELQRKAMEQQRSNEAELKAVLGAAKFREWQEYQALTGVRWEADRVRASLANAGVPLDDNLAKPLLKTLQEQQNKMLQQAAAKAGSTNSVVGARVVAGSGLTVVGPYGDPSPDVLKMQQDSIELMAAHQRRQREALAGVLTPEQLKVIEDEQTAELQMQRAQLRMMRAQQEAGGLDPSQGNNVGFFHDTMISTPSAPD